MCYCREYRNVSIYFLGPFLFWRFWEIMLKRIGARDFGFRQNSFEKPCETWKSRNSVRFFKWILCVIILCQAILSIYYIVWKSKLMTTDPNGPFGIDMVELCFEIFILCWCFSVLFFLLWRINTKMRLGMFSLIGWSAALFLVLSLIMGIALYIMEKVAQVMVKVSPKEPVK